MGDLLGSLWELVPCLRQQREPVDRPRLPPGQSFLTHVLMTPKTEIESPSEEILIMATDLQSGGHPWVRERPGGPERFLGGEPSPSATQSYNIITGGYSRGKTLEQTARFL